MKSVLLWSVTHVDQEVSPAPPYSEHGAEMFPSTHWSVVRAANGDKTPAVTAAIEALFRTYQKPLYCYIRRRGNTHHDAEDLLQAFFVRLVAKDVLRRASQARGRFRSFLLASLQNFLCNERDYTNALKRGGGTVQIPLDATAPSPVCCVERVAEEGSPDRLFDRDWAETIFSKALKGLEEEFVREGKQTQFAALAPFISRPAASGEYEQAAARASIRPGLMATAVLRLRQRFRDLVRAEIVSTVATPAEVEEELRYLVDLMTS